MVFSVFYKRWWTFHKTLLSEVSFTLAFDKLFLRGFRLEKLQENCMKLFIHYIFYDSFNIDILD